VPLSGFWSKDAILGGALFSHNTAWAWVGPFAYYVGTAAALGTAFYMTRLFLLTFVGKPRSAAAEHAHESSPVMTVPLWILAALSVVAVVLAIPGHFRISELFQHFMGASRGGVFASATEVLTNAGHLHTEPHPAWPYFLAWGIAVLGTVVAWAMYAGPLSAVPERLARALPRTYQFAYDKFRVDELYEAILLEPFRYAAYILWRVVDVFAIDGLLVNGVARAVAFTGSIVRLAQNGDVQRYAAVMAVAAAAILWTVLGVGGR
jgi:NADH-quinone oxidoreductase subunit L